MALSRTAAYATLTVAAWCLYHYQWLVTSRTPTDDISAALTRLVAQRRARGSPADRRVVGAAHALLAALRDDEFALSDDFNLKRELRARGCMRRTAERALICITPSTRVELQMARYRTRPIFGVVENKLIMRSLLLALGVPTLPVEYGALGPGGVGGGALCGWRPLDEGKLRASLELCHGRARGTVLKPATDGGNVGLLLLTGNGTAPNGSLRFDTRRHNGSAWVAQPLSIEALLSHARAIVGESAPSRRWDMRYELRGVLLQPQYPCSQPECARARGAPPPVEAKVHVVFGSLSCIIVEAVPVKYNDSLYVTVRDNRLVEHHCSRSAGHAHSAAGFTCERIEALVRPMLPKLAELAARISAALAADWFRMDVFMDGSGEHGLRVNEVTYPSHVHDTCALAQWTSEYRQRRIRRVPSEVVFRRISGMIELDNETFYRRTAYYRRE